MLFIDDEREKSNHHMIVLPDPDTNREVRSLSETLSHAQMLMKILTEEPSRKSDDELNKLFLCIKGSIPQFCDTKSVIKGSDIPERLKLRESLRKDIDTLIAKAKRYDMEPKAFGGYVMGDPLPYLKEMEEQKKEEMKQLQAELDDIISARNALKDIGKLDRQAKRLKTALNNPERAAKKPRVE